jgi:hypothetical protein
MKSRTDAVRSWVALFVSIAETPPGCTALRRHAESEPAGEPTVT